MEGLKTVRGRSFVAAGIFIVAALAIQLSPQTVLASKSESFMEKSAPTKVGRFQFQAGSDNPNQSYKTDDRTYEILQPFGVVGRIYADGPQMFDVLLIAGNKKTAFHDNRVCFQGQGWDIRGQEMVNIPTERGTITATYLKLNHQTRGESSAIFFYKGPHDKFYSIPQQLTAAMFMEQLKSSTNLDSVFYRFIPLYPAATKEELVKFVQEYLKEAQATSGGFY